MKVRVCYVSNSSSSSFLAIGKKVLFEDLKFEDGYTFIAMGKRDYGDGDDVFEVTKEFADYFKEKNINDNTLDRRFALYKCSTILDGKYKIEERGVTIKKDETFIDLEKDYHSTDCLDTFISNYEYLLTDEDHSYSRDNYVGGYYIVSTDIKDFDNTFCYVKYDPFSTYLIRIVDEKEMIQAKRDLVTYEKDFFSVLYKQGDKVTEDKSFNNCTLKWISPDEAFNSLKEFMDYIE